MKPADLLYSLPGRARRENTERTTKESGPPGQESSGLEAQGSSDFVHGFGRVGEGMQNGDAGIKVAKKVSLCLEGRGRGAGGDGA
jgi:hypothetical protein